MVLAYVIHLLAETILMTLLRGGSSFAEGVPFRVCPALWVGM